MARLVEFVAEEQLCVGLVTGQDKKKLQVIDARGRALRVAPDKVLFAHDGESVEELQERLQSLQQEVDVPLLWETLVADADLAAREAPELARLYFDDDSSLHSSAIYRALARERLHFRRRGRAFEPRSAEDLERLRQQRESEGRAARELAELTERLRRRQLDGELCRRIERFLRRGEDKQLAAALGALAASEQVAGHAFELLLQEGHLPPTADLAVLQADLQLEHREAALAHAAALDPPEALLEPLRASFAIDDPDTREVDDCLTVEREPSGLIRVDIDIADVGALVRAGDPVDREALRRATTVYLPTGTYFMLPERLGCDLLSLRAGAPRPAMRSSVWLDDEGTVQRHELGRTFIELERHLDYEAADALIKGDAPGNGEAARALGLLHRLAGRLAARRRESGALSFRQREWKLRVSPDGGTITVKRTPFDSPSRVLVAEFMILANSLGASFASEAGLPIIYRVQPPPLEPPPQIDPDDPSAFAKMRGVMQPATLSLEPSRHFGLGLERYTQTSSPLRRYADLVIQRQLSAHLAGEAPPYSAAELLEVLATAETTEREIKRLEATVNLRWSLEYVKRLERKDALQAWVLAAPPGGGYKVELAACGAQGLLNDRRPHDPGELVTVAVKVLKPRQGVMRLVPSRVTDAGDA